MNFPFHFRKVRLIQIDVPLTNRDVFDVRSPMELLKIGKTILESPTAYLFVTMKVVFSLDQKRVAFGLPYVGLSILNFSLTKNLFTYKSGNC
jgi:hypothetical protein